MLVRYCTAVVLKRHEGVNTFNLVRIILGLIITAQNLDFSHVHVSADAVIAHVVNFAEQSAFVSCGEPVSEAKIMNTY